MKKMIKIMIMIVAVVVISSCSKNDPTPVVKTNLDVVKAAMTGTWTFKSVQVTQTSTGKSATTSNCDKTELKASNLFTDTKWQNYVPEANFKYVDVGRVSVNDFCLVGNPTGIYDYTTLLNTDGTVNIAITYKNTYNIDVKNILPTSIKANVVNPAGYVITYTFER